MLSIENIETIDSIQENRSKGRWVLLSINSIKQYAEKRAAALEKRLFSPQFVESCIEHGSLSFLELFFGIVSPEIFSSHIKLLKKKWPKWPNKVGFLGFKIVEALSKEGALELAKGHIEDPRALGDFFKSNAVTQFITTSEMDGMDTITEQFLQRVQEIPNPFLKEIYERIVLTVSLGKNQDQGHRVFEKLLKDGIEKSNLRNILRDVYFYGTGGLPFYEAFREGWVYPGLYQGIAPLFREDAPLDFFDSVHHMNGEKLYRSATAQWARTPFSSTPLAQLLEKKRPVWRKQIGRSRFKQEFGLFLTAIMVQCYLKSQWDFTGITTRDLFSFGALPFNNTPWFPALSKALQERKKGECLSALEEILTSSLPELSKRGAVRLAGAIKLQGSAGLLLDTMEREIGNDLGYALANTLLAIGEESIEPFLSRWKTFGSRERFYALEFLQHFSHPQLIQMLKESWEFMHEGQLQIWCSCAQMSADEEMVRFLEERFQADRSLLDKGLLRKTYTFLTELLELTPPFLQEIRSHEERLKQTDEGPGLVLELECPTCKEVGNYTVPVLIVSIGFSLDHPLVGGDLKCHFCGVHPQFKITRKGFGQYIEELALVTDQYPQETDPNSPIQFVEPFIVKGARLSVPQALDYFRERVERDPTNPRHQLYLGHIYHKAKVNSLAIEHFEHTIALDPTNIEAPFFLAMIMEEMGRSREALEALMVLSLFPNRWSYYIFKKQDRHELGRSISLLYNWLIRKRNERDLEPLKADFLLHQKIGKNERCPCGSNKKFKVCCLKKGIY